MIPLAAWIMMGASVILAVFAIVTAGLAYWKLNRPAAIARRSQNR